MTISSRPFQSSQRYSHVGRLYGRIGRLCDRLFAGVFGHRFGPFFGDPFGNVVGHRFGPRLARTLLAATVAAGSTALTPQAFSQAYPAKPIRVVIPNEPGTLDFYVRMLGQIGRAHV